MSHPPDFRITIRPDGEIRCVDWGPWLTGDGPTATLLDERGRSGVFIADVIVVRADDGTALELIAEIFCGDGPEPRERLTEWATTVGYRHAWVGDDVVDLEPQTPGRALTHCAGCSVRLVDSRSSFWRFVRRQGTFPALCMLYGCDLPQWSTTCDSVRPWPRPTTSRR